MAYLDSAALAAGGAGRVAVDAMEAPATFSALEWNVVALAKMEPLRSLTKPGRLSRAIGGLFGLGDRSPLADPKLETLRRLAVYAWHRGFALPAPEVSRFLSAGYTDAHVETLVASITGLRIGDGRRRA